MARYFELFDREQFYVLTLAEFMKNPIETVEGILRFLDLDPTPAEHFDFSIKNRLQETYEPYDSTSDRIMRAGFRDLTQRTERIVGRPLDWSV